MISPPPRRRHESSLAQLRSQLDEAEAEKQTAVQRTTEARPSSASPSPSFYPAAYLAPCPPRPPSPRAADTRPPPRGAWQARRGHAEGREALSELNERLEAQRRQHDDATRLAQEGEAAAAQSTKAVLDAARQRAEAAEAQAEVEVEAARREARGARAEQAIAQEQAAEAQAALRDSRAGQQRSDEERDAAAAARHAEAVGTLQVQRDAAHERLRGEERRAEQLEADLASARAELTRAAAAREDADGREATLLGVQEQMAAQLGEVRMRAASGGGLLSTPGGMGFDEELPSPVSIPSLPISPMPSKWGAAASSHAPPTAHNLSGLSGGLSDTARARRGALEAENGALRAEVASLEAQALKMREAVSEAEAASDRAPALRPTCDPPHPDAHGDPSRPRLYPNRTLDPVASAPTR